MANKGTGKFFQWQSYDPTWIFQVLPIGRVSASQDFDSQLRDPNTMDSGRVSQIQPAIGPLCFGRESLLQVLQIVTSQPVWIFPGFFEWGKPGIKSQVQRRTGFQRGNGPMGLQKLDSAESLSPKLVARGE